MRQVAQKPRRKFCGQKAVKKRKSHPIQPEKGETGCVLGAGEDGNGCEQVRTDRKDRKARRNSWDGLVSAAASVGSQQSATGTHSPPGTRFWSGCGKAHQGAREGRCCPVLAVSLKEDGAVRKFSEPKQAKKSGKPWRSMKYTDENRHCLYNKCRGNPAGVCCRQAVSHSLTLHREGVMRMGHKGYGARALRFVICVVAALAAAIILSPKAC